jgi:hypothetical protein
MVTSISKSNESGMFHRMDKRSIGFVSAGLPSVDTLRISTDFDVAFVHDNTLNRFPAFRTG